MDGRNIRKRKGGRKREGGGKKYGKKQRAKLFKLLVQFNKTIKSQPYCKRRIKLFFP